jgi:hypothetical protein
VPIQRLNYIRINIVRAQLKGVAIVNHRFSKELFSLDFKKTIASAIVNLKQQRMNNFMGNAETPYIDKYKIYGSVD